ncbi:hypothetical protein [Modestobacter muralis]|uniref:hypothetical protein n=1 Tax=Modestobacter muralis TaxID=1608614 RepID=UPI001B8B06B9|nr:hypothetical protein [Modestobacter muralis]
MRTSRPGTEPVVTRPIAATRVADAALRLVVAAGLAVDAVVHLRLAPGYQLADPTGIGQGNLFRVEAVVAALVALLVLVTGSRLAYALAMGVAASALAAVVVTRYVEVPALGPIPSMYEPVWFGQKTASAVAEGIAAVAALVGLLLSSRSRSGSRP